MTVSSDLLYKEVSDIAYHFHWSLDDILDLEHPVRRRFLEEIGRLSRRLTRGG